MKDFVAPCFDFNWELAVIARCRALNEIETLDSMFFRFAAYGAFAAPTDMVMDKEALRRQRIYRERVLLDTGAGL